MDLPDDVSSAAVSLALNAGGGFKASVVVLLSPEDIDRAVKKAPDVNYHPPSSR